MTEDTVHLRLVTEADRSRIVEISSQIWNGHDYVPELLDGFAFKTWTDGKPYAYELALDEFSSAQRALGCKIRTDVL